VLYQADHGQGAGDFYPLNPIEKYWFPKMLSGVRGFIASRQQKKDRPWAGLSEINLMSN
jgi:hypothetical protein